MRIKTCGVDYLVSFRRGKDKQVMEITDAEDDKQVKRLIKDTYQSCPSQTDGLVKVLVRSVDRARNISKVIMSFRIANTSPRLARIKLEHNILSL